MDDGSIDVKRAAREAVYAMDLKDINPADPEPFRTDTWAPYFERLRAEDPVHWAVSDEPEVGGYWSMTVSSRLPETYHMATLSPALMVLPPSSMSRVARRHI